MEFYNEPEKSSFDKNNKLKKESPPIYDFCLVHGFTEFYKNGHCKECVKHKRYWKRKGIYI